MGPPPPPPPAYSAPQGTWIGVGVDDYVLFTKLKTNKPLLIFREFNSIITSCYALQSNKIYNTQGLNNINIYFSHGINRI